jgi:hypothetical protein
MTSPTQVNCFKHRNNEQAKDADRLEPTGTQSVAQLRRVAHGLKGLPV